MSRMTERGKSTVDPIVVCRTVETEVWAVEEWVSQRGVRRLCLSEWSVLEVSLMPSTLCVTLSLSVADLRNRFAPSSKIK
jgi:hypothetical protein